MSEAPKPPAPPPPPKPLGAERDSAIYWERVRKRPKPLMSVAFTVPVFLLYHLGVFGLYVAGLTDVHQSGFDFISTWMLRLIDVSMAGYVLLTLALALILLVTVWVHQKKGKITEAPFKRAIWESVAASVVALAGLGWAANQVLRGEASSLHDLRFIERVVLAIGAGFHEEFVFRGLLISGGSWLIAKLIKGKWKKPWLVQAITVAISCTFYALAHYLLITDDHFNWTAATFRTVEALFFSVVYLTRGFAVSVYSHTFYNLFTLLWYF